MAPDVDLNLADYIAKKYGEAAFRLQTGAAYAFSGERRIRSTLSAARPVAFALLGSAQSWCNKERPEVLRKAVRVTPSSFPEMAAAADVVSHVLGFELPGIYVVPDKLGIRVAALGNSLDCNIFCSETLAQKLSGQLLHSCLGWAGADIQNDHIALSTALHYLDHDAPLAVRIPAKPGVMFLRRWRRKAIVTCDRAALLCSRDFPTALAAIKELEGETSLPIGSWQEVDKQWLAHSLGKRAQALAWFQESAFYRSTQGDKPGGEQWMTSEQLDDQVLSLFGSF